MPLVPPAVRAAGWDYQGNLWISLTVPFTVRLRPSGDKIRTVQFKGADVLTPNSLFFTRDNRVCVTPGCYVFRTEGPSTGTKTGAEDIAPPSCRILPSYRYISFPTGPESRFSSSGAMSNCFSEIQNRLLQAHERETDGFDFLVGQRTVLHPPDRLTLEQLPDRLDQSQHELQHRAPDIVGIRIPARCMARGDTSDLASNGVDLGGVGSTRRGYRRPRARLRWREEDFFRLPVCEPSEQIRNERVRRPRAGDRERSRGARRSRAACGYSSARPLSIR